MGHEGAKALGLRAMASGFPMFDGRDPSDPDDWPPHGDRDDRGVLWGWCNDAGAFWPDFRDESGATLGVLLAQVRRLTRCPWAYVLPFHFGQGPEYECSWDAPWGRKGGSWVKYECVRRGEAAAMVAVLERLQGYEFDDGYATGATKPEAPE